MTTPSWRDRLQSSLHRQALPGDYVERLIEELSDHAVDVCMENPSMDADQILTARLGEPERLAAAARREFQRRTFAGRRPVLTFVVGPTVVVLAAFVLLVVATVPIAWLIDVATDGALQANDLAGRSPTAFEMGLMHGYSWIVRTVPFAFAAWFFAYLGKRSARDAWAVAACLGVALLAALFFTTIAPPAGPDQPGTFVVGFSSTLGADRWLQAAAPLGFGLWMLWRAWPSRSHALAT